MILRMRAASSFSSLMKSTTNVPGTEAGIKNDPIDDKVRGPFSLSQRKKERKAKEIST